jgi:hypothetical protein
LKSVFLTNAAWLDRAAFVFKKRSRAFIQEPAKATVRKWFYPGSLLTRRLKILIQ